MRAPLTCSRRLRPLSRKAGVLLVLVTVAAGCGGEDEPLASGHSIIYRIHQRDSTSGDKPSSRSADFVSSTC